MGVHLFPVPRTTKVKGGGGLDRIQITVFPALRSPRGARFFCHALREACDAPISWRHARAPPRSRADSRAGNNSRESLTAQCILRPSLRRVARLHGQRAPADLRRDVSKADRSGSRKPQSALDARAPQPLAGAGRGGGEKAMEGGSSNDRPGPFLRPCHHSL